MSQKLTVAANLDLCGLVTIKRRDMRTGEVDFVREQKKNLLLLSYLNRFFSVSAPMLEMSGYYGNREDTSWFTGTCFIGSDGTPPTRQDTGIRSELAATTQGQYFNSYGYSGSWTSPDYNKKPEHFIGKTFIFPAGVGTGEIREVALKTNNSPTSTGVMDNIMLARQIVEPAIVKSEFHQIEVEWIITGTIQNRSVSEIIPNGQIDGSPVTYNVSINYLQAFHLLCGVFTRFLSPNTIRYRGAHHAFFENYSNNFPHAIIGDSNEPSDVANDPDINIKGNTIFAIDISTTPDPYVAGSLQRKTRLMFETNQANADIAEIVLCNRRPTSTTLEDTVAFARITFDPPLQKVDTHRLYIDLLFSISGS